ncbi:Fur family transcriptional regulator [Roseibium limicola]|uniref:Transcriptional repressor n=1 Tax=Roseibium limicola TaxID=2816037 RepID=A0A939EPD8_9HYPH|nr:Fur family transcriptional regulator [Roseibium limicola]MBO0346152.1 transcriptional repressor [Roseibium limicola]
MHEHAPKSKLELTRNQALVFDALADAGGPLTAYAILDALREEGMRAPLQVYRALTKLMNVGLVHRLESLNAFVVCRHPECSSHETAAFAICETCGQVDEFAPDEAVSLLQSWASDHKFALARTTIELRGECSSCHK